ncbi:MAG: UDP-N-acetylmuramate dehydrogenase [Alphaproteobacteria bacterium]|nr:UDP-N-acetylmuramate dehydrogenase [Alphaproteobacteria bacterium]
MPLEPALATALDATGIPWEADVPLARKTYWRVGGPADALVTVSTAGELAQVMALARQADVPVFPLGNGSNLLVADDGVAGLVVSLSGELADSGVEGDQLVVGAGLRLTVLLARAARHGWPGLEAMAGIPGTVGGAVRMNAGTSLGEIGDRLDAVEVVRADGTLERLPAASLGLGYRTTLLPEGSVVTRAWLRLEGDAAASADRMRTFLATRKATQPLDLPSCGSTFRNPPGDTAGRLIDATGLKGLAIGGAQVSPKHANFLVNTGGATASELRALMARVQAEVAQAHGVHLEPEVQLVGRW